MDPGPNRINTKNLSNKTEKPTKLVRNVMFGGFHFKKCYVWGFSQTLPSFRGITIQQQTPTNQGGLILSTLLWGRPKLTLYLKGDPFILRER